MIANRFRRLLVRIGKMLPFAACAFLFEHYSECLISLIGNRYVVYDGNVILYTPASFLVGSYIEYNIQALFVLVVISIAVDTCIYNKLACLYLGVNLIEKSYFASVELYVEYIYVAVLLNMLASGFFVYKGFVILTKNR